MPGNAHRTVNPNMTQRRGVCTRSYQEFQNARRQAQVGRLQAPVVDLRFHEHCSGGHNINVTVGGCGRAGARPATLPENLLHSD